MHAGYLILDNICMYIHILIAKIVKVSCDYKAV